MDFADRVRAFLLDVAASQHVAPERRDMLSRAVVVLHVADSPRESVALPRCPHRILVIGRGDIPAEWQIPDDVSVVDARRDVIGWQGIIPATRELGEWLAGGADALVL